MDNRTVANHIVTALQEVAEALEQIAPELPPDRRARVEKKAQAIRGARSGIMAEMM